MKRNGMITAALCVAMAWVGCTGFPGSLRAETVTMDEAQLRDFIKRVIRENPDLLYNTINNYLREQQQKKQEQAMENALESRVETEIADHNPTRGPADAKITIIEYTDFECPYCARGDKIVHNLLRKYQGKVRRVYKNKPLENHEEALPAAKAAMAAHIQGKFWDYHDRLFENTRELDEDLYVEVAQDLGLDMEKFNKDRQSDKVAKWIESDLAAAEKHDITGTPAFILNGALITGVRPISFFSEMIDRLLEE